YALERTPQGEEWRWLARDAAIRLPSRLHTSAELRFRLSHDAPYERNAVRVFVNGCEAGAVTVRKGETAPLVVPIPPGGIVAERAAENPRIRMIRHEKNRKLGGALRSGFAAATKDVVLYMDADLPFDPDVLGRALRAMHVTGADVIAGYRHDRTMEGFRRT